MVDKKTGVKPKKADKKAAKGKADTEPAVEAELASPSPNAETTTEVEEKTTKAGKHSAKAHREAEEKQAKQERKTSAKADEAKPKVQQKPARSREERAGKKYREAAKLIEKGKAYTPAEALNLAVKTSSVKFDATVELHINLAVDPKQADQNIRGTVALPAGTGKTLRIAVFAEGDDAANAKTAGADKVGADDFLAELDSEKTDFDILITTPNMMQRLAKYARLLGPKGLMPNPKSGTVTTDVAKAVNEAKAGRLEYRVDSAGILHMAIGKVSFGQDKLQQNYDAVMSSVKAAKPASVKGIYLKSAYLTTSMGPSVKLEA